MSAAERANVLWFLPTHGDGRYLGTAIGGRAVDIDYLKQIAQAADRLGYFGVLLADRQELRGLLGRRLGAGAADGAASLPRGGAAGPAVAGRRRAHDRDPRPHLARPAPDQRRHGRRSGREQGRRHLPVARRALRGDARVPRCLSRGSSPARPSIIPASTSASRTAGCSSSRCRSRYPPLYFGGSSDAGIDVAAAQVDKYLTWGEPPAQVGREDRDGQPRPRAQKGRRLTYGIRLHVIVRETAAEAWAAADRLISHLDDATIASAQSVFARMDSVGQSRMAALHGGRRDKLEVSPNLWAGVGLVRGGAGHGAGRRSRDGRGAHEGVHGARHRYLHPLRLPASGRGLPLRRAGHAAPAARARPAQERARVDANMGPFGETIANVVRPTEKRVGQS